MRGAPQTQQARRGAAPPPKRTSALVTIYYKSRWLNFFLTFIGLIFIIIGIFQLLLTDVDTDMELKKVMGLIIGGGILAYLTIYANKRR
jgi:hypothetical protein